MRHSAVLMLSILLAFGTAALHAQAVPAAASHGLSLTVGATGSIFQPDFAGDWEAKTPLSPFYPVAEASSQPLFGVGAFVDLKVTRWIQFEAEGRWQRFNQYLSISQDNYLAGPRVPVYRFHRSSFYVKALAGLSKMTFDDLGDHGNFTTIAFGGGMDYKLNKRFSLRADGEYQYWPSWGNGTLKPYGASVGIGYKIF